MNSKLYTKYGWGAILVVLSAVIIGCGSYPPKQNDLKLWYNAPAADWNEALPIGNGRLGAMVFQKGTQTGIFWKRQKKVSLDVPPNKLTNE